MSGKTGLEIVQASYGTQGNFQDVTKEIQAMVKDGNVSFTVSAQSIGILDPAPGIKKTFQAKTITNGGLPVIVSKDDGEVFSVSAPTVKDKPKSKHFTNVYSSVWYALIGLFTMYFAMSAYRLGTDGMHSKMIGWMLLLLAIVSFGYLGVFAIFSIVFFYALFWPDSIDFSYAKNII